MISDSRTKTPMKHARITLFYSTVEVWSGSLYRFARDNEIDRAHLHEICRNLRPSKGEPRGEQYYLGGGASIRFTIALAQEN